ncbi:hypothetical protein D9615_002685 [Tricholomella constricta]|uniref:Beta-mannosidase A n=1 Tax=Tricholomella constricta TaxID=117010 RepID=A0A8H5HM48_9AGAR|nr:hypothetical protein D9615_002685 [Tricholomella constricta]
MQSESKMHAIVTLFRLLWIINGVAGAIFNVAQLQWTLKNQNGSIQIPAAGPPSHAHLDLANAGIITEPLLGINDFTQRWIIDDNWTYTADLLPFTRTLDPEENQATFLVFYGIDTVANISVGGHPVAWVNNQFRQYTFDISAFIAAPSSGDSNLTVSLQSAYHYALNVSTRPDAEHFPGNGGFEYPGIFPWVRKVASDFGWDWGPAFVPVGIYKPAYIVILASSTNHSAVQTGTPPISPSHPAMDDVSGPIWVDESSIDIYKAGQSFSVPPDQKADWVVNVTLALRSAVSVPKSVLTLSFPELNLTSEPFDIADIPIATNESFWMTVTWSIPDSVPQRWYPHNLGTPKLYNLSVILATPGDSSSTSLVNFVTRTGFRTIELAQTRYSQADVEQRGITPGDQWHFKINGRAFYSLGTNIIPFDPFYARMSTDRVRWVLQSAVKSGQNMVRVWGGGIYQPSSSSVAGGGYDFYSICDELGILAWSELIFSDALYPINDFMLETIEPEVRQNVRRVNRHPSNVQWAGGNEIEGIVTSTNRSVENGIHFLNEFVTLFEHFLHDVVVSETHSVPYTDCSTTKGVLSLDPYVLRFDNGTQGEIYGNGERYNYDASKAFDYTTFPVSRFMNEFGFHSMPSFYTWEEVLTSPDDFSFNSTVVMSREHHPPAGSLAFPNPNAPKGQRQMTVAVELWLPTPDTADTNQTFAQWCYSTQIFQTMTMVSQVAWYRHGAGKGENNLGALVWQLNDIWQGVSWSSVEYSGRWKVLQYGLTGIFAPVIIYPFWTAANETLQTLVISDRWEDVEGSAQLTWYDWLGRPLDTTSYNFTVPTLNNSVLLEASGLNTILPIGKDAADVWLLLNITAEVDGRTVTNEQYFTPTSLANAHLVDPEISVARGQDLTFTLSAKGGVAAWTWIDHPSGTVGIFVDKDTGVPSNGFYLIPGIDRTLSFVLNAALSRVAEPDVSDFVRREGLTTGIAADEVIEPQTQRIAENCDESAPGVRGGTVGLPAPRRLYRVLVVNTHRIPELDFTNMRGGTMVLCAVPRCLLVKMAHNNTWRASHHENNIRARAHYREGANASSRQFKARANTTRRARAHYREGTIAPSRQFKARANTTRWTMHVTNNEMGRRVPPPTTICLDHAVEATTTRELEKSSSRPPAIRKGRRRHYNFWTLSAFAALAVRARARMAPIIFRSPPGLRDLFIDFVDRRMVVGFACRRDHQ